ncbi:MAG: hypothetical protein QN177_09010 [Armatimonadota bacterium]|nr:hypothetical protein [Armatimonadota bacterium]MDR7431505.1 hypothetical protein [Armatimonadota bacterium]MDR7446506.1 hypothetical protein [Armatimonadota bacterium]MDR7461734.1 hypothetical protein [Armatimonadota bacterium]MDR7477788.1 hypothetical protein [Armatimonadota bacterium]
MRAAVAFFWIVAAAVEVYRRLGGTVPGPLAFLGPYLTLAATLGPAVEAVREFRAGELVEGIKSLLWAGPGVITLLAGPPWLRFGGG